MGTKHSVVALLMCSALACHAVQPVDLGGFANSASLAIKAATLTDAEVVDLANKSCAELDSQNKIAAPGSKYAKRLAAAPAPKAGTSARKPATVGGDQDWEEF